MTRLEQETFRDGFLLCLVAAERSRDGGRVALHAARFDGGREIVVLERRGCGALATEHYLALRRFLVPMIIPPHVVAGCGHDWRRLLEESLSDRLNHYRVLDLHGTATALKPDTPPGTDWAGLAQAYGTPWTQPHETPPFELYREMLWAVLAEAGRQGMDWPTLLRAMDASVATPDFSKYAFDPAVLEAVPAAPGVYLMRDAAGQVLYVGKSADLSRRLSEYFRPTRALSRKHRVLRDRIRDVEHRLVGSELEALLLEQRLIREHQPELNVQRAVAEGGSRYATRPMSVVVIAPSAVPRRLELFWFGPDVPAFQVQVSPRRLPRRVLTSLHDGYAGKGAWRCKTPRTTDWGTVGGEICHRYFARFRARLQWIEVSASRDTEGFLEDLSTAIRAVAEREPEPGEFLQGEA